MVSRTHSGLGDEDLVFGPVDQATRDRIAAADADILLEWIDGFANAESLGDVFRG